MAGEFDVNFDRASVGFDDWLLDDRFIDDWLVNDGSFVINMDCLLDIHVYGFWRRRWVSIGTVSVDPFDHGCPNNHVLFCNRLTDAHRSQNGREYSGRLHFS